MLLVGVVVWWCGGGCGCGCNCCVQWLNVMTESNGLTVMVAVMGGCDGWE